MDPNKVHFERQKSGIWGFQSERVEDIGGFSCKVCPARLCALRTKGGRVLCPPARVLLIVPLCIDRSTTWGGLR